MATKQYEWAAGATLEEHSRRKHKILREYFFTYLMSAVSSRINRAFAWPSSTASRA